MDELISLSNRVSVIGVGNTAYGNFPETDEYGLAATAFRNAIEDCGIDKNEVDGLLVSRIPSYVRMGEVMGIDPRWTITLPGHGRMSGMAVIEAMMALTTGQAKYVALLYANIGRSRRMNYGGEDVTVWDPWGFTSPGAAHAAMWRRHMEMYGSTTRQLGEISVAFREHAMLNPDAVMKKPITIDDHESARPIVLPLRLLDYCLINDGAVCLILTLNERARDTKKGGVQIAGVGAKDNFVSDGAIPLYSHDCRFSATAEAGRQAYAMAGMGPADVDALMAYDNFTPSVIFSLEGLGFCGRGEGGAFVENGALKLGGRLPTNTDGGHLSNSYMQGWALNIEAVRQLRGECGARQVPGCEVVQYVQSTPCTRSVIYTRL